MAAVSGMFIRLHWDGPVMIEEYLRNLHICMFLRISTRITQIFVYYTYSQLLRISAHILHTSAVDTHINGFNAYLRQLRKPTAIQHIYIISCCVIQMVRAMMCNDE